MELLDRFLAKIRSKGIEVALSGVREDLTILWFEPVSSKTGSGKSLSRIVDRMVEHDGRHPLGIRSDR